MIANYHTHTPRCRHAEGADEALVLAAIDSGLQVLGFSDHTPQWFPGGYYSTMRMYPEQLGEYCDSVRSLQKKYARHLQIHLGLEVEYYPDLFSDLLERLQDNGIEYFLLGQHWPGNEMGEPYCGMATADEDRLARYCAQVKDAMNTGLFTYLAHPDLINYVGDGKIYEQHMRSLCKEANACGIPIEINLWGWQQDKHYPVNRFWQIAAEENCNCIIGCDAHAPWGIPNEPMLAKAMELVRQYELKLLDTVALRPIG